MANTTQREMDQFLDTMTLFEGPDPEIMEDHTLTPRTDREEEGLQSIESDRITRMVLQNRLQSIVDEAREMLMHIAAAPGAKWGDLITALFTREGDMAVASSSGVLIFVVLQNHPVKHIMKRVRENPDYELRDGDIFMHNDSRYGNIHNTDQSCFLPIFNEGEHIAWVGSVIHEGENGATEPGGMPGDAESPYDEGLKIQPMRVGRDYEYDPDIVTFFQNSVRDKKLQLEDMKAKLAANERVINRLGEVMTEYCEDSVVGTMRYLLENTRDEVGKRISHIPNGSYRHVTFADNTLKDDCLIKIPVEVRVEGDRMTLDLRGASPEFTDRCNNTVLASMKGMITQVFLNYTWPDLPRNQAVLEPIEVQTHEGSALHCSEEVPNAQSMMTFFPSFTVVENAMMKALYNDFIQDNNVQSTDVHANQWNMICGWTYGGLTQHGDYVGNIVTDINTMPGGARWNRDGLHSQAAIFCAMGDMGETENYEEEYPFLALCRGRLLRDLQGFGKYRGGHGHQQVFTHKDTPEWGWMASGTGSRFPAVHGVFGGYAAPTIPACRVKGGNVFEELTSAERVDLDIPAIMKKKPFEGEYSTWDLGLQLDVASPGELYMISQGAGGGFGDVLDRDPGSVFEDYSRDLISDWVAENVYRVVIDDETGTVDEEATRQLREETRRERLEQAQPFDEFVEEWETEEPPDHIPYFGSWKDRNEVFAGTAERTFGPEDMTQSGVSMKFFRRMHPELFDTPVYPPAPEYQGDLERTDGHR